MVRLWYSTAMWRLGVWFCALFCTTGVFSGRPAYTDAAECAACHPAIAKTYKQTGMGRSFHRAAEDYVPDGSYYHEASDRYYAVVRRGGEPFLRRWQQEANGPEFNVEEKRIDYVLGSGNHARSYVSRAPDGRLLALPLAWYAEDGGKWAMAPGYDRPDQADFRREIGFDCMFCHNGYPEMETGAARFGKPARYRGRIPEGIDCQRCHGPGSSHVEAARRGAGQDRARAEIVNPARLSHARQLEVCLQCHLESTSRRLPYAVRRYHRDVFSYRPGEPLGDYMMHLDLAPGSGRAETFEVVNAGYQFLKSACYRKSGEQLTCTTCHNPHDVDRGEAARTRIASICQRCHDNVQHRTPVTSDCIGCHMQKRRTDDAVHVVMTEHLIRRTPLSGDLLSPKREVHEAGEHTRLGRVVPLYPRKLSTLDELYLAVAQVRESANLREGIPRLQKALEKFRPTEAPFYFELGEALRNVGKYRDAARYYEQAIERDPNFPSAARGLGSALHAAGDHNRAIAVLEKAAELDSESVETWNVLGSAYDAGGRPEKAIAAWRRAMQVNPDTPEAHLNLGVALSRGGNRQESAAAFREAIRLRPDFAAAHNNLAVVLEQQGQEAMAARHFERAIELDAAYAGARYNYGLYLARRKRWAEARTQLEDALRLQPATEVRTALEMVKKLEDQFTR